MTIEYMNQSWLSFRKSFRSDVELRSAKIQEVWVTSSLGSLPTIPTRLPTIPKGLRVSFASTDSGFPWFTTKSSASGLVWAGCLARRHIKDTSPNSQPQEFSASHNEVKPDSPFGWTYLSYNLLDLRESQFQPVWQGRFFEGTKTGRFFLLAWTCFN